jgi:hypothetical protein
VDKEQSYGRLKFEEVLGEVESTAEATESEVIVKKYIKNKILKEEIYRRCWACLQHERNPQDKAPLWHKN